MKKHKLKKGFAFCIFLLFLGAGALTSSEPIKNEIDLEKTSQNSEIILETSFEEEWVLDSDGDYLAPPGWDVDGICQGANTAPSYDLKHYWSQMNQDTRTTYETYVHDGNASAYIWWSNGEGESSEVEYNQDEWLISPNIDLSNYISATLTFWTYYSWNPTYSNNHDYVKISTDDGKTWNLLTDLNHDTEWFIGEDGINRFDEPVTLNLSSFISENPIKIAFHYSYPAEGGRFIWIIDDVEISGVKDTINPSVSIKKPNNAIYFGNKEVFPFFIPVVFGSVNIEVDAIDDGLGIDQVEIYVDGVLQETLDSKPYVWLWSKMSFGKSVISAKAVDKAGNSATPNELTVYKLF